jgi:hypothetical protein
MPASNGRFHASGGVCPPESLWDFASFVPRTSGSEPPPSQSRFYVVCNARATEQQCDFEENKVENFAHFDKSE